MPDLLPINTALFICQLCPPPSLRLSPVMPTTTLCPPPPQTPTTSPILTPHPHSAPHQSVDFQCAAPQSHSALLCRPTPSHTHTSPPHPLPTPYPVPPAARSASLQRMECYGRCLRTLVCRGMQRSQVRQLTPTDPVASTDPHSLYRFSPLPPHYPPPYFVPLLSPLIPGRMLTMAACQISNRQTLPTCPTPSTPRM